MGQDPDTIRQQIADTRSDMDDTLDALGHKADVKGRAKDSVREKVDAVGGRLSDAKKKVIGQAQSAGEHLPDPSDVGDAARGNARRASSVAQENPIGLALGAVAIGFLGGLLLPVTKLEAERVGPVADELKDQAREAGRAAYEHGAEVANEAVDAAREAVKQAA